MIPPDFHIINLTEDRLQGFLTGDGASSFTRVMNLDNSGNVSDLFSTIFDLASAQICDESKSLVQKGNFLRCLCRRDTSSTVNLGLSFLGICSILLFGREDQKIACKDLVSKHGKLCFAVSERDHGSDVFSNEFSARRMNNGDWMMNGEKWLIGNGSDADCFTILARTSSETDDESAFSLFCVFKSDLRGGNYFPAERTLTEGVKAMNLGGFSFKDAVFPGNSLIGEEGDGLRLILLALQVHRAVLSFMPIGILDTGLRLVISFTKERLLYGSRLLEMHHVKCKIIDCFLDLVMCEILSWTAARLAHFIPELLLLYGNAAKYENTTRGEKSLKTLSEILGARGFVRFDFFDGLFGKLERDVRFLKIVDGSSDVLLDEISGNLRRVFENIEEAHLQHQDILSEVFSLEEEVPGKIDSGRLQPTKIVGKDSDPILATLVVKEPLVGFEDGHTTLQDLSKNLRELISTRKKLRPVRRSFEMMNLADRYCKFALCGCAIRILYHNRTSAMSSGLNLEAIVNGILFKIWREQNQSFQRFENNDQEIFSILMTNFEQTKSFSLVPITVKE